MTPETFSDLDIMRMDFQPNCTGLIAAKELVPSAQARVDDQPQ